MPDLSTIDYNNWKVSETSPRCSGSSNNMNLPRSRYARLTWDIDQIKYENVSSGTPKRPEKGQEWIYHDKN